MIKNKKLLIFAGIGFCAFIVSLSPSLLSLKATSGLNDLSYWHSYYFSRKHIKPFKFVAVAIDDNSLHRITQRWPWKRSVYAQLITALDKEKSKAIGIDLEFLGASEVSDDDAKLEAALKNTAAKVVIAASIDPVNKTPIFPLGSLRSAAYYAGIINTPADHDGKVRRVRAYYEDSEGVVYYSFPVALAAAFLDQTPQDCNASLPLSPAKLISLKPFLKTQEFSINYLIRKPSDIITVSFYDVLENLEGLKQKHGQDFLNDALVLVYPAATIRHDIHPTPLGEMAGGFLHFNGAADIVTRRFIKENNALAVILFIFSAAAILYILATMELLTGFLVLLFICLVDYWFLVLLNINGIKFDFSRLFFFNLLFFLFGSIYRYADFWIKLLKIKDKAVIDPVRGLFTLRYFYYRLNLEFNKIFLGKELYLLFIRMDSLKEDLENVTIEQVKNLWQQIREAISLQGSFWSGYIQPGELIGCVAGKKKKIDMYLRAVRNNLKIILHERKINSTVRIGYLKIKKEYPIKELLFILSKVIEKYEDVVLFKDNELAELFHASLQVGTTNKVAEIEVLEQDIEEKNREFLTLIENLRKEHARTKEAFFQIILSLAKALEARDPYTEGHSERVCNYAVQLAVKFNWSHEAVDKLKKASLLHDLGKIGIPDTILHKKGGLNADELDFIRKHEIIAVKILEPLHDKDISEILPWILYHHEKWDGTGYPHGLAGNAIPLASQFISLADVFDALTTGRDYRGALSPQEAINEIVKNKGTQFNPQLVDIFVQTLSEAQARSVQP